MTDDVTIVLCLTCVSQRVLTPRPRCHMDTTMIWSTRRSTDLATTISPTVDRLLPHRGYVQKAAVVETRSPLVLWNLHCR